LCPDVAWVIALLIFSLLSLFARASYEHNYGALRKDAHQKNYLERYVSLDGRATRSSR
jgi:hypothetical protein